MTKWMLAAGAAALAIVSPATAQQGGGKDKGGQSQKADRGAKVQDGGKAERGAKAWGGHAMKMERGGGKSKAWAERGNDRAKFAADNRKGKGRDGIEFRKADRIDKRDVRIARIDRDDDDRFLPRWNENGLVRGFHNGCPPGLVTVNNGCMPRGQFKKIVGTLLPASLSNNMLDGPFREWYRDDDNFFYRNDGDYIYRVQRQGGLIDALFPSADRDFYYYPVGMNYPSDYNFYNVPNQYSSYYPDGGNYAYRYGDGAIYQVNPSSGLIQGIAALLAGDLSLGQRLPSSYGAYNVPMSFRDRYYDTNQDWYRYNDGYIYRVDPTTQLVTAVINAIV